MKQNIFHGNYFSLLLPHTFDFHVHWKCNETVLFSDLLKFFLKVDLKKTHCITKHPKTPPIFFQTSYYTTADSARSKVHLLFEVYLLPHSVGHGHCSAVHPFPGKDGWTQCSTVTQDSSGSQDAARLCIKLGNTPRCICTFADLLLGLSHWSLYSRQMVESENDTMYQGSWRPTIQYFKFKDSTIHPSFIYILSVLFLKYHFSWEDILQYRLFEEKFANTIWTQSRCARCPFAEGLSPFLLSETLYLDTRYCSSGQHCHLACVPGGKIRGLPVRLSVVAALSSQHHV